MGDGRRIPSRARTARSLFYPAAVESDAGAPVSSNGPAPATITVSARMSSSVSKASIAFDRTATPPHVDHIPLTVGMGKSVELRAVQG